MPEDAQMTAGSPMAGGTSKQQLTLNEHSGRQALSALPTQCYWMTSDWENSK